MRVVKLAALLVAAGATSTGLASDSSGAAADRVPVMGVITSPTGSRLTPLDPRTLAPLRGGWSRAVRTYVPAAVSPSGVRVAAVLPSGAVRVLDTVTGRAIGPYRDAGDSSEELYWLGGDGTTGTHAELLIAVGFGCYSHGCGDEYSVADAGVSDSFNGSPHSTAALKEGLAFAFDPQEVYVYGRDDYFGVKDMNYSYFAVGLGKMPRGGPFRLVADAVHDRLFVISSAGVVGMIQNVARRPRVTYHRVPLNGRPFEAAWAGHGRIALWGQDGLGTIDVRRWVVQHIASGVKGAVTTRFGIVAWTQNPAGGLMLYRPEGRAMWRVLEGTHVRSVHAVAERVYADADARYSIDLRTGAVIGPLQDEVTIITPDLVLIA